MTKVILPGARLRWPTDWTAQFGREAPLLLEIGFGAADFLMELAQSCPHHNVVGVEISLPSLRKAARKARNRGLTNVAVIQGSGEYVLQGLFAPGTVSGVYLLFPDPWPKHPQRRLIHPHFLQLLATRMCEGATLDVATDHADYAQVIADCLAGSLYFDSRTRGLVYETADSPLLGTKYEQKGLQEGRPGRYFHFRRNATAAPLDQFPVLKERAMPHVVMQSPLSLADIAGQFEPSYRAHGDTGVKLIELFHSAKGDKLLVEAYVNEYPLKQRVGIVIRRRQDGALVVALHEIGFPRPTDGLHVAVHQVAQWLLSLHPQTSVRNSTLQLRLTECQGDRVTG